MNGEIQRSQGVARSERRVQNSLNFSPTKCSMAHHGVVGRRRCKLPHNLKVHRQSTPPVVHGRGVDVRPRRPHRNCRMRASSPYGSIRSSPSTDPDLLDRRADQPEGLIAPRLVRQHRRLPPLPLGEARIEPGLCPPRSRSSSCPPARALLERTRRLPSHRPPAEPRLDPGAVAPRHDRPRRRTAADRRSAAARANPPHARGHREDRVKLLDPTPHEPMRTVAPGSRHRLPCPSASPAGIGLDARACGWAR